MTETDVLVVGAGPTGLTCACELARHGIRAHVIDEAPVPSDKSKAFAVHARTLELFENMGMVDAILATGRPSGALSFYDSGKPLVTIDIGSKIPSKYPFIHMVAQSETERVLTEHLHGYGSRVQRSTKLLDVATHDDGVTATVLDPDGSTPSVSCRYLVGADGAHSTVRKQLGLQFRGGTYPNQWLLADIHLDWDLPYDQLSVFFHGSGTTAFFPLDGRRGRLMFEVPDASIDTDQPEPTLDDVRGLCERRAIPIRDVTHPQWLAWFRLHHRMVERYSQGRIFLAGDAAHIHSPIGGQGMNMGIQDAYNLAWKLALVVRGKAAAALLDSYHEERHRADKEIVGLTHRATTAATIHNPIFSVIRNAVLGIVSRLDAVQTRMVTTLAQVAVHYRRSSIVRDDWKRAAARGALPEASELRAGERVPDFPLRRADGSGDTTLYELLEGAEHELLMFCGASPSPPELAELDRVAREVGPRFGDLIELHVIRDEACSLPTPAVASTLVDPGLAMHAAFGAAGASLVLVRPDGYIGYRQQPADLEGLLAYLASIFVV